jgi:hypothetical protein
MNTEVAEYYFSAFGLPPSWRKIFFLMICLILLLSRTAFSAEIMNRTSSFTPDHQTMVELKTTPGLGYIVEASTDLKNWSELFKAVADSNSLICPDFMGQFLPRRFYRTIVVDHPSNDKLSDAIELSGPEASSTSCNINATREEGEPTFAPLEGGSNSIWWRWTAPQSGPVYLSTVGSMFETLVAVFRGTDISKLELVGREPVATRRLSFEAEEGVTYAIGVAGSADTYGIVHLYLKQDAGGHFETTALAGLRVILKDDGFPWVDTLELVISDDGKSWQTQTRHVVTVTKKGMVLSASGDETNLDLDLAVIDSEQKTNLIQYKFEFQQDKKGRYELWADGSKLRAGKFSNFRTAEKGLAVPDLGEMNLLGTRRWTSTGPMGQTHRYTFAPNHMFHDSDKPEQACGTWKYEASGDRATLVLDYTGPSDFVGDHHELEMTFTDTTKGTFTSRYDKNDKTVITILGDFELDDD